RARSGTHRGLGRFARDAARPPDPRRPVAVAALRDSRNQVPVRARWRRRRVDRGCAHQAERMAWPPGRELEMRKWFEYGGACAAVVLIVCGVVAIAMGVNGRNTVRDSLKQEAIVGTPDMNKTAIAAEAKKAGLPASIKLPTTDVAGKPITTGARARAF